jgi:hypothetical protein
MDSKTIIEGTFLTRVGKDFHTGRLFWSGENGLYFIENEILNSACDILSISPDQLHNDTCGIISLKRSKITNDHHITKKVLKVMIRVIIEDIKLVDDE